MSPLSRRPAGRSPPGLIQHLGDLISCLRLSGPQAAISIGDGGTSKDPQTRPLCKEGNRRGKGASSEIQSQILFFFFSGFYCSFAQLCPIPCDPMDSSTPSFPVHHQLPELAQSHVHRVSDAIQPSHPLSSPSPAALSLPQHQGLFQ